jgi:hypothetical protein
VKRCWAICLLALSLAPAMAAQVVVDGRVIDDLTARGLPGARVTLLNVSNKLVGDATTDELGHFHLTQRRNGWYRLEITAIGYQQTRTPFVWPMNDYGYTRLEVRLAPHVSLLAPVEVVALSPRATSPVLANVEFRRTHGLGVQITREQIEARKPANVSDMLAELPGVYAVHRGSGAGGRVISMTRALAGPAGGPCVVQIFLDGQLATRNVPGGDVVVDELVSPLDVEVVEVFRGLGSIPAEFLTLQARCGVIAIWTKRAGDQAQ